jgi:DNA-binding NarL/FixJ family response regulator
VLSGVALKDGSPKIRVLVADDHPALREGITAMLERENMEVVAQASDGDEAVALYQMHKPGLTLIDLHMPRVDGLTGAAQILKGHPQALIIVLTSYDGDVRVSRALDAGVRSYLLKTAPPKEFIATIHGVLQGHVVVNPLLLTGTRSYDDKLTGKEISVVRLIAQGIPNRDIGKALNVSEHTIKARVKSILAKLGAHDRSHAVTVARDRGYLDF